MTMHADHTPVTEIHNLGPASRAWLEAIDVHTAGDVRHLGVPLVMHILRERGFGANMNLAYALHAGLQGRHWQDLSPDERESLRAACSDE